MSPGARHASAARAIPARLFPVAPAWPRGRPAPQCARAGCVPRGGERRSGAPRSTRRPRVRRAAALVFCASLAAPLLGAGGSAEAQNTPDTTPPTLTSATVWGGEHIELQFSENIPLLNQPPGSAFTVTADGVAVTTLWVANS